MAKGDSPFGQIVGGEFEGDFVAGQNADTIPAQAASQVGQHNAVVIELDTEQTAGKFLQDGTGNFDAVFFAHIPFDAGRLPAPGPRSSQAAVTLVACKPLGPLVTSNSTLEPSSSVR
jgi:hypothetical protein